MRAAKIQLIDFDSSVRQRGQGKRRSLHRKHGMTPGWMPEPETISQLETQPGSHLALEVAKGSTRPESGKEQVNFESLPLVDAGLNRPLSFSSQHRTGLRGADMVRLDVKNRKLVSTDTWIKLDWKNPRAGFSGYRTHCCSAADRSLAAVPAEVTGKWFRPGIVFIL